MSGKNFKPGDNIPAQNKIWIKHLPLTAQPVQLGVYFSSFGDVAECQVITDGRGKNTGVGFVAYQEEEVAIREATKPHTFQGERLVLELGTTFEKHPMFPDILNGRVFFHPRDDDGCEPLQTISNDNIATPKAMVPTLRPPTISNPAAVQHIPPPKIAKPFSAPPIRPVMMMGQGPPIGVQGYLPHPQVQQQIPFPIGGVAPLQSRLGSNLHKIRAATSEPFPGSRLPLDYQDPNIKSVYVSGFTWWISDLEVYRLIAEAIGNNPFSVIFDENKQNGKSLGSIFVDVLNEATALNLIRSLNGRQIHRKELKAELFNPPDDDESLSSPTSPPVVTSSAIPTDKRKRELEKESRKKQKTDDNVIKEKKRKEKEGPKRTKEEKHRSHHRKHKVERANETEQQDGNDSPVLQLPPPPPPPPISLHSHRATKIARPHRHRHHHTKVEPENVSLSSGGFEGPQPPPPPPPTRHRR